MANKTLLSGATTNGAGTAVELTGSGTVQLEGDSVLDGARIEVEVAKESTAAKFQYAGRIDQHMKAFDLTLHGTNHARAVVFDAGDLTNLNLVVTQ